VICVVLIELQPAGNATFFFASVSKLLHFFLLHDEAHRIDSAGHWLLIGVGFRRRSASQAIDLPSNGGVNLGRLVTLCAQERPSPQIALQSGIRKRLHQDRKIHNERNPAMVALAKKLARYTVNGRKRSLRDVAAELAAAGYLTKSGQPYAATAISRMIAA
jgi:hypothetical protein